MAKKETIKEVFKLTMPQKKFCEEYIFDWNGSRAYKVAYPKTTDASARVLASGLLTKVNINEYIEYLQKDLAKIAGISPLKVLAEHMKLAFSSIAHLHNTWIERKEFEALTDEQKACIAEISTKTQQRKLREWDEESQSMKSVSVEIEYIQVKLYDKQKALDSITKMLGFDAPTKNETKVNGLLITVQSEEQKRLLENAG